MINAQTTQERLLNLKEVQRLVPLSKVSIYKLISENSFPKQVKIGRSSYWPESEIGEFVRRRMNAR